MQYQHEFHNISDLYHILLRLPSYWILTWDSYEIFVCNDRIAVSQAIEQGT